MMSQIKKWIHDITTEPDNDIVCPVRLMAIGGCLYFFGAHAYTVIVQHAAFDLSSFGTSFGVMLATAGAALGLKTDTKPTTPNVVSSS